MQTPGPAGADQLSEQEQTLLSEIQDLQRQLWELKAAEASNVAGEGEAEQPDLESIMGKDRLIMVSNRLPVSTLSFSGGFRRRKLTYEAELWPMPGGSDGRLEVMVMERLKTELPASESALSDPSLAS